jgi:hypothetical protein
MESTTALALDSVSVSLDINLVPKLLLNNGLPFVATAQLFHVLDSSVKSPLSLSLPSYRLYFIPVNSLSPLNRIGSLIICLFTYLGDTLSNIIPKIWYFLYFQQYNLPFPIQTIENSSSKHLIIIYHIAINSIAF